MRAAGPKRPSLRAEAKGDIGRAGVQTCISAITDVWDSPDPREGLNPHFLQKRVSPLPLRLHTGRTREFSVKKSPFPLWSLENKKGFFWTENSLFQDEGKSGSWTPKPSFAGNGDSGPVWGRGYQKSQTSVIADAFKMQNWGVSIRAVLKGTT